MPPSSNPPRKFAPTPIEQTTKSSRQSPAQAEDPPKPRRFAPEPVEETIRSSKDKQPAEQAEKPKPRRFAPEPVEHSTKSSKDVHQQQTEPEKTPARRFAPQVVEESHTSSKGKPEPEKKVHVKFKPEPVSVSYGSNRKAKHGDDPAIPDVVAEKKAPRKFTPILLDTAKRSRRTTDPNPAVSVSDKTESGYHLHAQEYRRHITGEHTPAARSEAGSEEGGADSPATLSPKIDDAPALRRQISPIDGSTPRRSACLTPARQHSFRMPELETIESSESEADSNPSPTSVSSSPVRGGSPVTVSESSQEFYKHATRIRESVDETFTHYLLDLERKKQQKKLEEQALAAFPNPDFGYVAPNHYGNNDDDSEDMEIEDRPVTFEVDEEDIMDLGTRQRRESTNYEQLEMQKYAEEAQQERNANQVTTKKTAPDTWWKPPPTPKPSREEPDNELKSMRDRARPPMLGNDIVFPRCPSPDPARFDVTQGSATLRNQMCYLTEAAENERKRSGEDGGLWQVRQPETKRISTVKSVASSAKDASPAKGLWGGFCVHDSDSEQTAGGLAVPYGPTGLMTPKGDGQNPFELAFTEDRPVGFQTPPTPPASGKEADMHHLSASLVTEAEIDNMMEREFPDAFITQVYNYLSLGYPSLARPFDDELCKISRFSVAELRKDDEVARSTPRGYIRLGPDFEGGGGEGLTEESCMRWQALKRYVREWAKQEKNMVKSDGLGFGGLGVGTGARRGSWAI